MKLFTGVVVVLAMPFAEDETLALTELQAEVDDAVLLGADAVAIGPGSEIARLSEAERGAALRVVVEAAGGRVPVVMTASGESTRATRSQVHAARSNGADLMLVTPPRGPFGQGDVFRHYEEIASREQTPIVIQDVPEAVRARLPVDLLVALARDVPEVVGVQIETPESALKISAVVERIGDAAVVLGGTGGVDFARELDCGARGTLIGPAFVSVFRAVWLRHWHGDASGSRAIFERHVPLVTLATRSPDAYIAVQKELLCRQGLLRSVRLRRPHEELEEDLFEQLDAVLASPESSTRDLTCAVDHVHA